MAIGKSSPEPPLRTSPGARLTVTRLSGQGNDDDNNAARTRSRDSRHASSGRPTMENAGRPGETWTSTVTGRPRAPRSVADESVASTDFLPDAGARSAADDGKK